MFIVSEVYDWKIRFFRSKNTITHSSLHQQCLRGLRKSICDSQTLWGWFVIKEANNLQGGCSSRPHCEIKKKKNIIGKLPDTAGRTGLLKFIQYWALENLLLSFWPSFHRKSCILGLNFSSDITSCVTSASCLTLLRLHLSTGPKGSPTKYTIYFSWMVLDALRFGFSNTVKWMTIFTFPCLSSIQFSHSIMSDSLQCQASLTITNSWSPPKSMSTESVMPSNHLILCRPLLFLPSIFPSIRVFSNESALHIRWLKYWSFSFNISPSNEHSGLISFRMNWLGLLAV